MSAGMFGGFANAWDYRLDHAFDAWAARRVRKLRPDMVVCYENSALHTFKAARAIGAVCVLDAASVHYQAGRAWLAEAGVQVIQIGLMPRRNGRSTLPMPF